MLTTIFISGCGLIQWSLLSCLIFEFSRLRILQHCVIFTVYGIFVNHTQKLGDIFYCESNDVDRLRLNKSIWSFAESA